MSELPASIVMACHSEQRWPSLLRAIDRAQAQEPPPEQMIIAVDHNPHMSGRLRDEVPEIEVIDHFGPPGASGTRDAGAALATAPVLAFLDHDVRPRPGWLRELLAPLADRHVVGTGGMTVGDWQQPRPRWFPDEFGWVLGLSYAGLPTATAAVRNVWSENMVVRREAFEAVGGFRADFGKRGPVSRPEDTDLCLRISASLPGARWLYVPSAVVDHEVPPDRATIAYYLHRCYWEGVGKVELSAYLGSGRALGAERSYLRRNLPRAFVRAVREREFARAVMIGAGVCAAATGAAAAAAEARSRR